MQFAFQTRSASQEPIDTSSTDGEYRPSELQQHDSTKIGVGLRNSSSFPGHKFNPRRKSNKTHCRKPRNHVHSLPPFVKGEGDGLRQHLMSLSRTMAEFFGRCTELKQPSPPTCHVLDSDEAQKLRKEIESSRRHLRELCPNKASESASPCHWFFPSISSAWDEILSWVNVLSIASYAAFRYAWLAARQGLGAILDLINTRYETNCVYIDVFNLAEITIIMLTRMLRQENNDRQQQQEEHERFKCMM